MQLNTGVKSVLALALLKKAVTYKIVQVGNLFQIFSKYQELLIEAYRYHGHVTYLFQLMVSGLRGVFVQHHVTGGSRRDRVLVITLLHRMLVLNATLMLHRRRKLRLVEKRIAWVI